MILPYIVFFGLLAYGLYKLALYIIPKVKPTDLNKYKNQTKKSYAIITGASEGIGAAWAKALAKKGFNLVLLARSEDKLNALSESIKIENKVDVIVIPIDLSKGDNESFWDSLVAKFSSLDIAILVNNVGVVNYLPGNIDTLEFGEITNMINLNVRATTVLTQKISKLMLARKHLSAIINLSSFTALLPSPMLQVYGATKSYVKHLSKSIAVEYKGSIDVLAVAPWYVCTSMTMIRKPSLTKITPDQFVNAALPYLGQIDCVDPWWAHYLLDIGVSLVPSFLYFSYMIKFQTFVRGRLLKKKEEQAKKE